MAAKHSSQSNKWIFVSHSSADLEQVRKVRNYLEEKGASPLLFHLLALDKPEEFWPLIRREIRARNFFLYCVSPAAQESSWVMRERDEVARARQQRAIRIGTVDVSSSTLDRKALDDFIAKLVIYPSFTALDRHAVYPYLEALSKAGFDVFRGDSDLLAGSDWRTLFSNGIAAAARNGWVLVFLSWNAIRSEWVQRELEQARSLGARFVPVLIGDTSGMSEVPEELRGLQWVDCSRVQGAEGTDRLVRVMLTREIPD